MLSIPAIAGVGRALYRPWLDRRIDRFLGSWYFPLSRAWAAALAADGIEDRFREQVHFDRRPPFLQASLRHIARAQARYSSAEDMWRASFFDGHEADLAEVQGRRRRSALAFMGARADLVPLRALNLLPAVRWQIASHEAVEAAHGYRLAHPERAFELPAHLPEVASSRKIETSRQREYWLRFPSPLQPAGGLVWAHLFEPLEAEDAPTLIFMHGIAVEPEFVPDPRDAIVDLVGRGVRVVVLEGLWHGRRRPDGYFGGELVLATAPLGFLDYFHATALEVAALIRWARSGSAGAVGVGGYSLGAISASLVAEVSASWPDVARPDATLLIAHGAQPAHVALEGSLMRRIGFDAALGEGGWDLAGFERWMPLVAPMAPPAVDPGRVVAVVGEADELTPSRPALDQMRRWRVPQENVFHPRRGHYTIAPGLAFDREPLELFLKVLAQT